MKTAKQVILAIVTLLSLITSLLWSSGDAGEKRAAPYFLILTFGALAAYIFLLLRSKHIKNQGVPRITPKAKQDNQQRVYDAKPKTKQESLRKAESTLTEPTANPTPKPLPLGQAMGGTGLPFPTGHALDEIQTQILKVLARQGGDCGEFRLKEALRFLRHRTNQSQLAEVTIDYHLHALKDERLLEISHGPPPGVIYYSLTQKGRKYVIDNDLATHGGNSN